MSKRHADALMVDNGACNPSGIVHSILEAFEEIRNEDGFRGTNDLKRDVAVRLMVNHLSYLVYNGEIDANLHRRLREQVKALAGGHAR